MASSRISSNVAAGAAALQSSFSKASRLDDPLGAVSGVKTGRFGFHTEAEDNPWWMLDLGKTYEVDRIVVYNRGDGAQERARHLSIFVCEAEEKPWQEVYRAENVFGGLSDDRAPLTIDFGSWPKSVRFVKISLNGRNYLHLDEVEVYGRDRAEDYRNKIAKLLAVVSPLDEQEPRGRCERSLGAIVVLTRGYEDVARYQPLKERNRAIYEHINSRVETQYPVVIWHEGNILPSHQDHILENDQNSDVRFVDVSQRFRLPMGVDIGLFRENWPMGIRLMGRFNTFDIWQLASEFEYVLRVDEDCVIEQIISDPFLWAKQKNIDYAASVYVGEGHELTNATLPHFIDAYLEHLDMTPIHGQPYNQCFPYTNLGLARTAFFLQPEVLRLLKVLVSEQDFYSYRWGDLPVLGVALNLFSEPERMAVIPSLIYQHESHSARILGNDHLRTVRAAEKKSVLERYSPSSPLMVTIHQHLTAGHLKEAERLLLNAAAAAPGNPVICTELYKISNQLGRTELAARLANAFIKARQPLQRSVIM